MDQKEYALCYLLSKIYVELTLRVNIAWLLSFRKGCSEFSGDEWAPIACPTNNQIRTVSGEPGNIPIIIVMALATMNIWVIDFSVLVTAWNHTQSFSDQHTRPERINQSSWPSASFWSLLTLNRKVTASMPRMMNITLVIMMLPSLT